MYKRFTTVKDLVYKDLENKTTEEVKTISSFRIDEYYSDLIRTKAHLCTKPIKFSTVNRYVEYFVKDKTV